MKKFTKFFALLLVVLMTASMLVACDFGDVPGTGNEDVDTSKTQLYIYCWNGGYGVDWLYKLKNDYEALHANDSYEAGKTGVQIMIDASNSHNPADQAQTILAGTTEGSPEIYFSENRPLLNLINGNALLDISDVITGANPYETGKTIESKMSAQQKQFTNVGGKYYAIPSYQGEYSLSYDIGLFEEKGFYFIDGYDPSDALDEKFILPGSDEKRTAGPDGEYDTLDDGLPTTYEEFFWLCDHMVNNSVIPMTWTGEYLPHYMSEFLNTLVIDYEGAEQGSLNYTHNGVATDLGTIKDGQFVFDEQPTTITYDNAQEIRRQAGLYYSLTFMEKLLNYGGGKYHDVDSKAFGGSYSHKDAQKDFLLSSKEGGGKPIAMIMDGSWWEHEALDTFNYMEGQYGTAYSMQNRRIGSMPLPKAFASQVGTATHNDAMGAFIFIKSNINPAKISLAKDFLMFANTDRALVEFSVTTNTLKALDYEIPEAELAKMSIYGQTLYNNNKNSATVNIYSNSPIFANNSTMFQAVNYYLTGPQVTVIESFHAHMSVTDAFNTIYNHYKESFSR